MNFLLYLIIGSVLYVAGFVIYRKIIRPKKQQGQIIRPTSPLMLAFLVGCFGLMLLVSAAISCFVLAHTT